MHNKIRGSIFNTTEGREVSVMETEDHVKMVIPLASNGELRFECEKAKKICGCEPDEPRQVTDCVCDDPCFIKYHDKDFLPYMSLDKLEKPIHNGFIKHFLGDQGGFCIGLYSKDKWNLQSLSFSYESSECNENPDRQCRDIILKEKDYTYGYIKSFGLKG